MLPIPRARSAAPMVLVCAVLVAFVAWVAADVWVPICAAAVLAFVLRPFVRALMVLRIPAWLGALLVVTTATCLAAAVLYVVHRPALDAIDDLPRTAHRAVGEVRDFKRQWVDRNSLSATLEVIDNLQTEPSAVGAKVVMERPRLEDRLMDMGVTAATTASAALLLVYFFLVHGETLFRRLVEVMPTLSDKRRVVDIVRRVQSDVSRYLLSITIINAILAVVVSAALFALGVENALFWGFLAGLLNYMPYVGPLVMIAALTLVGLGAPDHPGIVAALAPAVVYTVINLLESTALTPTVLGRQFSINPVVILLWLLLWGWLWGIPGLLLGVPLLVCVKVILQRSESGSEWALLMETRPAPDPVTESASKTAS